MIEHFKTLFPALVIKADSDIFFIGTSLSLGTWMHGDSVLTMGLAPNIYRDISMSSCSDSIGDSGH